MQNLMEEYHAELTDILQVLDHPEAFITEDSMIGDFLCDDDEAWLAEVRAYVGQETQMSDRLIDVAKRLRQEGQP
jgi:hypothetical protein